MFCFIFSGVLWGHCHFLSLLRVVNLDRLSPVLDEGKGEREGRGEDLAEGIIFYLKFVIAFLELLNW